jgi:hypothetical protein
MPAGGSAANVQNGGDFDTWPSATTAVGMAKVKREIEHSKASFFFIIQLLIYSAGRISPGVTGAE